MRYKGIFVGVFLILCCFLTVPVHADIITEGYAYPDGSKLMDWKNQIKIGYYSAGTGSLEVNTDSIGNGFKTATGTTLYIGNVENSMGTVTVEGDGTSGSAQIIMTGQYGIQNAVGGTGILNISNGGLVEAFEGEIRLGSQGLAATAGTALTTVDGSGSILRSQQSSTGETWERKGGRIWVSRDGMSDSVVNITNGGLMEALSGNAGDSGDDGSIWIGTSARPGSNATVNVDGNGSMIKASNYMEVGGRESNINAKLNITNGASVDITGDYGEESTDIDMTVRAFPVGGEASVTVSGVDSTLKVNDLLKIGGDFAIVGFTSAGTPAIEYDRNNIIAGQPVKDEEGNLLYDRDGNVVMAVNHSIVPGYEIPVPSTWTDGNKIYLNGSGSVNVENEAELHARTIDVSSDDSSSQTYNDQVSTLTVQNNGVVYSDVNVYAGGIVNGNGTIQGDVFVNGGTLSPGNSPGTMTIDGDLYATDNSIFEIEVVSFSPGYFDVIDIKGDAYFEEATFLFDFSGFELGELGLNDFINDSFDFVKIAGEVILGDISYEVIGKEWILDIDFASGSARIAGVEGGIGSPVPEPATVLLFGLGLLGFAGVSRRKN